MDRGEKVSKEKRRKEMKSEHRDQPNQKDLKSIETYKNFIKDIRQLVRDSEVHSSDESLRVELDILFKKVKGLITGL